MAQARNLKPFDREPSPFMWRDTTVDYADGAIVFIDNRDAFAREPYSAQFRSLNTGTKIAIGTVQITHGRNIEDRLPEIQALANY